MPALGVFEVLELNDDDRFGVDHALENLEAAVDDDGLASIRSERWSGKSAILIESFAVSDFKNR
jgi:hypothetical protein